MLKSAVSYSYPVGDARPMLAKRGEAKPAPHVTREATGPTISASGLSSLAATLSASYVGSVPLAKWITSSQAEETQRPISVEPAPTAITKGAQPSEDQGE